MMQTQHTQQNKHKDMKTLRREGVGGGQLDRHLDVPLSGLWLMTMA
jgi:hypothetical protein